MKKIIAALLLIIVIFVFFKIKSSQDRNYLVKINNYTVTQQEFDEEFKASSYAKKDTPESRKEFLNMLIRRKLVLQEAQVEGFDKNKEFLKSITRYWEQSLLDRFTKSKSHQITESIEVPYSVIEAMYAKLKNEGKTDKPLDQMYSQIKASIIQLQESEAVNRWLTSLYMKADIKINPDCVYKKGEKRGSASVEPSRNIK
ncbi:MAG TPA: SurA N-terminal domain-containing protein [Candidatus Omnitrophota bacterium]|nr:SurA N-terminal domain-containing protein [Candidatus Omnitrophota bacterium]